MLMMRISVNATIDLIDVVGRKLLIFIAIITIYTKCRLLLVLYRLVFLQISWEMLLSVQTHFF